MAPKEHSSSPTRDTSADPELSGAEQRTHALGEALLAKDRMGYEIESQTDFEAVIFTPSPRRWLWTRTGHANDRLVMTVDDECRVTTRRR